MTPEVASEVDRVSSALEAFVKSLEKKSAGFRNVGTTCLAFAAFLGAAIIQYGILEDRSQFFQLVLLGAFISAIICAGISIVVSMVVNEQAASVAESLTGVKLGFAGKIKSVNDAIDAYNHETRYYNQFGPLIQGALLTFGAMCLASAVSVLIYVYEIGVFG